MERFRKLNGRDTEPKGLVSGMLSYLLYTLHQDSVSSRTFYGFLLAAEGTVARELQRARYPLDDLVATKLIFDYWWDRRLNA